MRKIFVLAITLLILSGCGTPEERLVMKADRLHGSMLTVDTHCDTPMEFSDSTFDLAVRRDEGCVDFPRMKEGGLHAEFFAVFIGQGPRNDTAYDKVHANALKIFDALRRNISKNSSMAELALTASDAYRIKKDGRIAAFIGVENGYPAGRNISRIGEYYNLGARYLTLTHTSNNDICDSSTDRKGPEHGGLSGFGEEVVKEMNRLGMMVDVSHISDEAFYDVLQVTKAPVLASHSSCRALCGSPRNLTDDMILALKENGGVIQICILSDYLKAPEPNPERDRKLKELQEKYGDYASLPDSVKKVVRQEYREIQKQYEKLANVSDVVDHIDHVVQVAGIDYAGIGTDFDGGGRVEGCSNASEMKNITIELLRRGYSRSDIEKIWGANVMRVLKQCENLAASL